MSGQQTLFSIKDENAWVRAREFCVGLHQELVRQQRCELQTHWRTNNHLKKTTAQDYERMRQERIRIDAASMQVVRDATHALEQQQHQGPIETGGDEQTPAIVLPEWTCPVCTYVNQNKPGSACAVCTWSEVNTHAQGKEDAADPEDPPSLAPLSGFACTICTAWNTVASATRCAVCDSQRDGHRHEDESDDVRAPLPQVQEQLLGGPPQQQQHIHRWPSSSSYYSADQPPQQPAPRKPRKILARWECIHCTTSNIGSARKCSTCRMRKATL
jgi:hypothetical protein